MDGPKEIFFERGNPLLKNLVSLSEKLAKILQDLQDFYAAKLVAAWNAVSSKLR